MKKMIIMFLTVVSGLLIGGCDSNQPSLIDSNLQSHLDSMGAMDTYVIKFTSDKMDSFEQSSNINYVYVDNVNETFVLSPENKDDENFINKTDLVFQYENNKLFNIMFDDVWIKHEISSTYFNVKNFETEVMKYLHDISYDINEEEITYVAYLSLNDVKDSGFQAFGDSIPEMYFNVDVPLTIKYSKTEERFISFELDFTPVMIEMDQDLGLSTSGDDSWIIKFEYERLDKEYNLIVDEYVIDDFVDGFYGDMINGIKELYSYDLIKGSVNYNNDQDLIRVEFTKSGIYQLSLRNFNEVLDLNVTILDVNHKIITTFVMNSDNSMTSFWNYAKGTYYVLVSGDLIDNISTDYRLIFMSN